MKAYWLLNLFCRAVVFNAQGITAPSRFFLQEEGVGIQIVPGP
jgi:hypothetical protein